MHYLKYFKYNSLMLLYNLLQINDYKMVIILPNELEKLTDVESKLISIDLKEALSSLTEKSVNIYLPKFKIRKSLDMDGILGKV